MESREKIKDYAIATLTNIWSCINWDKIDSKRVYNIWDEFANKVKAAAYTTNKYEMFVEKLCKKFNISSLKYKEIMEIENKNIEIKEEIMTLFREETLLLVLELKMNREIKKEITILEKEREEIKNEN